MPVHTDVILLAENPESEGEWAGYPDAVARKAGEPVRCRLLYRHETEEPGLFIQMALELLFADDKGCISHFRPLSLPENMAYTAARTEEGYQLRFVLGDALQSCPEEALEFVIESAPSARSGGITVPTAVTLSGIFRGDEREEVLSMEKPGPIWLILQDAEPPAGPAAGPKIVKVAPPGKFWQPEERAGEAPPEPDSPPYKTIRVAPRPKHKHFYW